MSISLSVVGSFSPFSGVLATRARQTQSGATDTMIHNLNHTITSKLSQSEVESKVKQLDSILSDGADYEYGEVFEDLSTVIHRGLTRRLETKRSLLVEISEESRNLLESNSKEPYLTPERERSEITARTDLPFHPHIAHGALDHLIREDALSVLLQRAKIDIEHFLRFSASDDSYNQDVNTMLEKARTLLDTTLNEDGLRIQMTGSGWLQTVKRESLKQKIDYLL